MASPNRPNRFGGDSTTPHGSAVSESVARSDAASQYRRNDESWVEISSQPSSSSLSSMGDEIVTTGLRVGNASYPPRRRRLHQQYMPSHLASQTPAHGGTSSQEEYDETESEEDKLMTSSTENMRSPGLPRQQTAVGPAADSDSDSDDDENATALGRPTASPSFRPQPNAFSHPPSHLAHRSHSTNSSIPQHPSNYRRPSMSQRSQTRVHRGGPNFMSPSYQADNDAALRASLTTLLSCAAAARGLPKSKEDTIAGPSSLGGAGVGPSSQPMELRLVPESELMTGSPAPAAAATGPIKTPPRLRQQSRTASNSSSASAPVSTSSPRDEKAKRAAATQSRPSRATKKKKTAAADAEPASALSLSPTLLTWVVSAGVVVLVSVVGFGAGYVIGREVGRQEAAAGGGLGMGGSGAGANASSCGRELVRGTTAASGPGGGTLRRFRWTTAIGRSVAA
ncbi:hypothetical protein NKR23_g769 [Pleurostoma richardsiae]|uniref:Uncharacterized protein n=1 Tax=Pleurostoma richardsiae TaxID=41990 RepID=A0AA38SDU1_9PEZI|nr:hypothetical protein NKR23_g769 [Pleurostoma richardsiae]